MRYLLYEAADAEIGAQAHRITWTTIRSGPRPDGGQFGCRNHEAKTLVARASANPQIQREIDKGSFRFRMVALTSSGHRLQALHPRPLVSRPRQAGLQDRQKPRSEGRVVHIKTIRQVKFGPCLGKWSIFGLMRRIRDDRGAFSMC